jgi:hypothetical protein
MKYWNSKTEVKSIKWFIDGKRIISGHKNGSIIIWNSEIENNIHKII